MKLQAVGFQQDLYVRNRKCFIGRCSVPVCVIIRRYYNVLDSTDDGHELLLADSSTSSETFG